MITVTINDVPTELPPGATIDAVVEHLGCGRRGTAVAVNAEVVPRSAWSRTPLHPGDQVEVLRAVQGGC